MRYCKKCILPDSRPNLIIDADGVCNACKNTNQKTQKIDWNKRKNLLAEVVKNAKKKSKGYDCLIPVSGGKDSTWQVVECLKHGLTPLAVTWKTPARTELGQQNLDNLVSLGVDHIDYQISPKVERKFLLKALEIYGATAVPMHMAMFNIPLKIAVKFDIPLVVWGENSAFEYGSEKDEHTGFKLNTSWLKKFGVTHGTSAKDWISKDLSAKDLSGYFGPSDAELDAKGVLAVFLGYYLKWDPENSLKVASSHGFKVRTAGPKTGLYNYADIDDDFISIHHYLKWYKFGFTRLFDNLSLEIRNQRISRNQALNILIKYGAQRPDEDIAKFCDFVGISEKRFNQICEKFRNNKIWTKVKGKWIINNFIVADWDW